VNYSRTADRTKAWEHKPESEWVYQPVPAIISGELWERCASRQRSAAPGRGALHLFAGFAYCACGSKMRLRWVCWVRRRRAVACALTDRRQRGAGIMLRPASRE
jgi:hypothetical protein